MTGDDVVAILGSTLAAICEWEQALHQRLRAGQEDDAAFLNALDTEIGRILGCADMWRDADLEATAIALDPADLLARLTIARCARPRRPASGADEIARLIAFSACCDAWFISIFSNSAPATQAHEKLRQSFDMDGAVRTPDGGILIPKHRESWRALLDTADGGPPPRGLIDAALHHVIWLPPRLHCDHADNPGLDAAERRAADPISVDYVRADRLVASPIPQKPLIAVAPLAERGSDLSFVPSACCGKYALEHSYGLERFEAALALAAAQGAHILLIPEMALPEGDPAAFADTVGDAIFAAAADYAAGHDGQYPALRLVAVGTLGGVRSDGYHRNYCVLFDGEGRKIEGSEQHKLSHWNLNAGEQSLFGIDRYHRGITMANPIKENSLAADRFVLVDIPGIGRMASLICADMSQDNPGDWILANAAIDWLHAPIMDKSICWQHSDAKGWKRPWIVRRSVRAAQLLKGRVIATNSMALTRWVNETNRLNGQKFPEIEEIGIALALDHRADGLHHCHVTVPQNERGVVRLLVPEPDDWGPYPDPVTP